MIVIEFSRLLSLHHLSELFKILFILFIHLWSTFKKDKFTLLYLLSLYLQINNVNVMNNNCTIEPIDPKLVEIEKFAKKLEPVNLKCDNSLVS